MPLTSEQLSAERARLVERFGRRFGMGETIFREGDPGTEMFIVEDGRVRLVKRVRLVERSLVTLRPGELFGETALLEGSPRPYTAEALTDCLLIALDGRTFETLIGSNVALAVRVVKHLARRLRDAEDQIENMLLRDNQSKLVNALIKLAQGAAPGPSGVVLSVTPLELSGMTGIDVESVRRGVEQLREGSYVQIADEQIIVEDVGSLRRLFDLLGMKEELGR